MENTGDQLKPNSILDRKVSRREALKGGAKVAAGVGVLGSFGRLMRWIDNIRAPKWSPPSESSVLSSKLPDVAYKQPPQESNSLKDKVVNPSVETPIPTPEATSTQENQGKEITVNEIIREFFPNYTDDEKEFMRKKIDDSIKYFKTQRYPGHGELEMAVVNSIRWKDLVDSTLKNMDLNKNFLHSKVPDLFTSLIFVESEGNPQAYNEVSGATGLTQVVPLTAGKEISEDLGEPNFDLSDPATSIRFGIYYLAKMYKEYPEVGLDTWVYHLGMGNLLKTIRAKLGDETIDFDSVAQRVIDNHLNLANLLNSPFTEEQIKEGNFSDMTEEYVSRILAGYYFQKKYLAGQLED